MVESAGAEAGLEEGRGPSRLPADGEALELPSVEDRDHRNGQAGLVGWAEHASTAAGGSAPGLPVLLRGSPAGVARTLGVGACL